MKTPKRIICPFCGFVWNVQDGCDCRDYTCYNCSMWFREPEGSCEKHRIFEGDTGRCTRIFVRLDVKDTQESFSGHITLRAERRGRREGIQHSPRSLGVTLEEYVEDLESIKPMLSRMDRQASLALAMIRPTLLSNAVGFESDHKTPKVLSEPDYLTEEILKVESELQEVGSPWGLDASLTATHMRRVDSQLKSLRHIATMEEEPAKISKMLVAASENFEEEYIRLKSRTLSSLKYLLQYVFAKEDKTVI